MITVQANNYDDKNMNRFTHNSSMPRTSSFEAFEYSDATAQNTGS